MKAKHQKTLEALFSRPAPSAMNWTDLESLFLALGAQPLEGSGSAVRFVLNGKIGRFHRPHPCKEALPYQLRDARDFLTAAGCQP
ncbi:MAG: type II toxin-antitoxin system HicA family toxin [Candidatus Contendobacter sp.]|jgi:hypothetical protein|nr:type II toxin-antitoxin system HicA family toxin [Candidatus Contendobacter sp.]